jgi:hypothetical protein
MTKTITIIILVVLLIASNAWQVYGRVDQSVTMKYMDMELYELRHRTERLEHLADAYVAGMPIEEFRAAMEIHYPDDEPFVKEGGIHYSFLSGRLNASGDTVMSIK